MKSSSLNGLKHFYAFSALAFIMRFALCASSALAQTQAPLRVGALFPLTGTMSDLGQETFEGAKIALDLVNEAGGIKGTPVEFVLADVPTPAAAKQAAQRLIAQDKVPVILGCYGSAQTLAIVDITEENQTVLWVDTAWSSAVFDKPRRWTFRTSTYAKPIAENAVDFISKRLLQSLTVDRRSAKVIIVHEDGPYGASVAQEVSAAAQKAGMNISKSVPYNRLADDLSETVKVIRAENPDIMIAISFPNDAVALTKQLKKEKYWPKAVMTTSTGWALFTLPADIGADAEGIFVSDAPANIKPDTLTEQGRNLRDRLTERFRRKTGRAPSPFAMMGFVAAYSLLKDVMTNAKDPSSALEIRKAAISADVPSGSYPNGWGLKFEDSGQNQREPVVIEQWQDGSLVTVDPPDAALGRLRLPAHSAD